MLYFVVVVVVVETRVVLLNQYESDVDCTDLMMMMKLWRWCRGSFIIFYKNFKRA